MYQPKDDGITHINTWTKGKTVLGRQLSNLATLGFMHPKHGYFRCMEAAWYFFSTGGTDNSYKELTGFEAKKKGRNSNRVYADNFQDLIKECHRLRIEQNPILKTQFLRNKLPLAHYFCYGEKLIQDKHQWQTEFLNELQAEYHTSPKIPVGVELYVEEN